jgi:hypothetical protein
MTQPPELNLPLLRQVATELDGKELLDVMVWRKSGHDLSLIGPNTLVDDGNCLLTPSATDYNPFNYNDAHRLMEKWLGSGPNCFYSDEWSCFAFNLLGHLFHEDMSPIEIAATALLATPEQLLTALLAVVGEGTGGSDG